MQAVDRRRRRLAASALLWSVWPASRAQTAAGPDPEASERWQKVRRSLFGTRPIAAGAELPLVLEAPVRADDAAVVPIAVRAGIDQSAARYVKRVVLVIDNNPSPIAAIFQYTPASGRADIETRVRVDEYTHVRAIAETSDGRLYMSSRYLKASGGCSAPPGKDAAAARATMGRMRLRVDDTRAGGPALAQLMISHPNDSGLVMDQLTRQYTPAHFVRSVEVTHGGKPVLSADLDFAISENPHLRFRFIRQPDGGELRATVVDSHDQRFESALKLAPLQ